MYMREVDDPVMIQYIILFTLAKAARRVTHSQLTCLTLDRCNINFANFQIALDNLVQIEYVRSLTNGYDEKMPVYELTEKGEQANGFFSHSIPIYIREQIEEYIAPFFEQEQLKRSVRAKLVEINSREYGVECALYDSTSSLMELTLYAGTRETAARMIRWFKSHPEDVYAKIMKAVLGEDGNEKP